MKRNRWGVFGMAIVVVCVLLQSEVRQGFYRRAGWLVCEVKLYRRRGAVHVTGHRRDGFEQPHNFTTSSPVSLRHSAIPLVPSWSGLVRNGLFDGAMRSSTVFPPSRSTQEASTPFTRIADILIVPSVPQQLPH